MKEALALLALGLLAAPGPLSAEEAPPPPPAEGEFDRPWDGFLPDPDQGLGDEEDGVPASEWYGLRVLDAATGRPVPGARWVRTPERGTGGDLRADAVMQVAVTDAEGIARMESLPWRWKDDCHWLVLAEGYAPAHEYATIPETEVLLRRGRPFRGALLDPLGRPVAGGSVEYLGGCSHGTAALRATTAADGTFALGDHRCRLGQYWIEGPGIASDLVSADEPFSLGSRPGVIVGIPGHRYEGRILDPLGRPLAACVVRSWNEQRGPATITDAEGRFVLEGVEGDSIVLFPEGDLTEDTSDWDVHDAMPGVPLTVVVTSLGVVEEEETATVRIAARTPDGKPAGGVCYRVLREATGRGPSGITVEEEPQDEDDPPLGTEVEEVVPGRFRVVPDYLFDSFDFEPVEGEVAAGGTTDLLLAVRPRPRLRVKGTVPGKALLVLAVPGDTMDVMWNPADPWSPHLPREGPAVLRVEMEGAPPFFFPVGQERDGFREATVSLPPPRRVLLPKGSREAELLDGDREVAFRAAEGALETWAEGRVTLRYDDGTGTTRELALDLPPLEGGAVEVRPGEGRALPKDDDEAEEAPPPPPGPCVLALRILDGEGKPADALVLLDGAIHPAPEGTLLLEGLAPGPHRLLVARRDDPGGGRELRVLLAEGKPAERTVRLGEE